MRGLRKTNRGFQTRHIQMCMDVRRCCSRTFAQGSDSICPSRCDFMRARLENRRRDGQQPGAGFPWPQQSKAPTMKTLLLKITALFLRGAQAGRGRMTQCEFGFPKQYPRRNRQGRTVLGRHPHSIPAAEPGVALDASLRKQSERGKKGRSSRSALRPVGIAALLIELDGGLPVCIRHE